MGLTRPVVALMLEIAGGFLIVFGIAMLALWAGVFALGLLLILFGLALERFEP